MSSEKRKGNLARLLLAFVVVCPACAGSAGQVEYSVPAYAQPYSVEWSWQPGTAEKTFSQTDFQNLIGTLNHHRPRYGAGAPVRYHVGVTIVSHRYSSAALSSYSFGVLHLEVFDRASGRMLCDWALKQTQRIGKPVIPTYDKFLVPWMTTAMVDVWDRVAAGPCSPRRVQWASSPPDEAFDKQFVNAIVEGDTSTEGIRLFFIQELLTFLGPQDAIALLQSRGAVIGSTRVPPTAEGLLESWLYGTMLGVPHLPDSAVQQVLVASVHPSYRQTGFRIAKVLDDWRRLGDNPSGAEKRRLLREAWERSQHLGFELRLADLEERLRTVLQ